VVQQRGISPAALFDHGTDALYAEPAERSYPLARFQSLFARAIHLTEDPALGLHCGLHASEASFGLMAPLVSHAPTLRHALALVAQFQPLLIEGAHIQITEHMGVAQLRCELDHDCAIDRSFVELVVAGLVRTVQAFGCARSDIRSVCFEHSRPAYYHAYAVAFSGAERFAQGFTGIEFSARALDRPHLHRHSELHKLVLIQAEHNLERLWRPLSCTDRVRALMNGRPASALPDMAVAARALGLSVRSLRRRLDDEGTSYRELTQSALHESACSMLRNPVLTLQTVAHQLGFADPTAFHRAFRRWAKLTPAEYRTLFAVGEAPPQPDCPPVLRTTMALYRRSTVSADRAP
jgi:AraC-like DNA-binding protein